MAKFFYCVIALFALLCIPKNSLAVDLKINEFLADPAGSDKEWVEIYAPGSPDLSGYYLKDKAGTKKSLTNLSTCGNYVVWELEGGEGWLNNSSEESIYLYSSADQLIDEYADWNSPGENKPLGRFPDHSGDFQSLSESTKCGVNSAPVPTPTPSPSSSPTLSPSPSPTATPVSSPTSVATPAVSSSPKTKASPSPSPTPSTLGESTAATEASNPSPSPDLDDGGGSSKTKLAFVLTGAGIFLILLSGGFYLMYKRLDENKAELAKDKAEKE